MGAGGKDGGVRRKYEKQQYVLHFRLPIELRALTTGLAMARVGSSFMHC